MARRNKRKRRPQYIRTPGKRRKKSRSRRILPHVVPDSKVVKLRYVDIVPINAGPTNTAVLIFRANSINDPDHALGGHQPLGHDQWANFYDHYTVIGAKITCRFTASLTSGTQGATIVGIMLKDNATTISSPRNIMEQGTSGYKVLTGANAGGTTTVTKGFSTKKFFGLKDVSDNRSLVGAAMNADPPEDAYFHVYVASIDGTSDPGITNVLVTIQYIVKLTERKALGES